MTSGPVLDSKSGILVPRDTNQNSNATTSYWHMSYRYWQIIFFIYSFILDLILLRLFKRFVSWYYRKNTIVKIFFTIFYLA